MPAKSPALRREALAGRLTCLGLLVLAAAAVWWWLVFRQVIDASFMTLPQALPCLASDSDTCSLAQALCTRAHALGIKRYWSELFWLGLALVAAGSLPAMTSRRRA